MPLFLPNRSKVLVIVAHADDEVLGCGGTISRLVREGHEVTILLPLQRSHSIADSCWIARVNAFHQACSVLGATGRVLENGLLQEEARAKVRDLHDVILPYVEAADVVMSHWKDDAHQVHRAVSHAVEIATRPFRRQKTVLLFEVATSTDQGYRHTFSPNVRVVLEEEDVERKCQAMGQYPTEIAPGRTNDAMRAMLVLRGSEAGVQYAEAFVLTRGLL